MKSLFTLIIVIVLLVVGYKILFQKPQPSKSTTVATPVNRQATPAVEKSVPDKTVSSQTPPADVVELPKLKKIGQHDQAGKITSKRVDSIGNRINQLYNEHNKVNATGL